VIRQSLIASTTFAFALFAAACGGDGDTDSEPTAGPSATPVIATASPTAGGPSGPTPTLEGFTNARQALDAFIRTQLGAENIGPCPQQMPPGGPPEGICTTTLLEGAILTTFLLGVPFGEGIGELVLTRDAAGQVWTVTFVPAPVLGEELAVGKTAVVFGAGDCLNFRETPAPSGEVVTCQLDGTTGAVIEGPTMAGGVTWWNIEGLGWASAEFLGVAAE
jgi:hypothetical protein